VACGAALASFIGGAARKVVFVACDRPMFWLHGRPGIETLEQLAKGRVATFPDHAPPAKFLQKILGDAGFLPGLLPARDDISRLGLLTSHSVEGALISSLFLPYEVEKRGGHQLAFVGDTLRIPSTGLACSGELYCDQPELVAVMVDIFRQAMSHIFADDEAVLRSVLREVFNKPEDSLDQAIAAIRQCYNPKGASDDALLQNAIEQMASGMQLKSRPFEDLYSLD